MTGRVVTRHETIADRAARSARAWSVVARAIGVLLTLATVGFGVFLMIANDSLRGELADTYDELTISRAETSALYDQLLSIGERPVVTPDVSDPDCPVGYSIAYVWISLSGDESAPLTRQPAAICRPTP